MVKEQKHKSPLRKLVKFFEQSRDNWKAKYQKIKKENKQLKNQNYKLKLSQQKWKVEAFELRKQLSNSAIQTNDLEDTKKNRKIPPR